MAGRPRKRLRELQQQVLGELPDAMTEGGPGPARDTRAAHAHARAHAYGGGYAGGPTPGRAAHVGPVTRNAADTVAGNELAELARMLAPGTTVRVERLRPSWAAGWVEDLELDRGSLRELYDHVANEWGGQKYRLSPLLPSGAAAFSVSLAISGPPLREGHPIDRDEWEGLKSRVTAQRAPNPAPAPAPAAQQDFTGLLGFMKLLMETQKEASVGQLEAVKELVRNSAAQNQDLIQALAEQNGDRAGRQTFAAQLGELVSASKALDGVRKVLGGPTGNSKVPEEDDVMKGALKEATAHFMKNAMGSIFQQKSSGPRRQGGPPGPPPGPPRRPPNGPPPSGIPDAVSGHMQASRRN